MHPRMRPTVAAMRPFSLSPSERLAAIKTPEDSEPEHFPGPEHHGQFDEERHARESRTMPRSSPMKLVNTLIPRATSASPFFVRWYPSMAVGTEAGVPGTSSTVAEILPP